MNLHIEYPDGFRNETDVSIPMTRYDEVLGNLDIGKSVTRTLKTVVFGDENSQKDVKITVEYRVPGSNGIFYKDKTFSFLISSSPVNITVKNSTEVNANQKMDFNIEVKSNSLTIIKGLALKADYPSGFDYKSSSITPGSSNNIWDLGDLQPGATKNIKISGVILGQDGEEKVFKFSVGLKDKLDVRTIATTFASFSSSVLVKKPFVGMTLTIDGNSLGDVAIPSGQNIKGTVAWENNLPDTIYDLEIDVSLKGNILDKSSVSANGGFYDSLNNQIVFSKQTGSDLSTVLPGASGSGSFDFSTFDSSSQTGSAFSNPQISFDISVKGRRTDSATAPKEIFYTQSRIAKITSDLSLLSRGFYFSGPFKNIGPIPPRAEKETTYTIVWTATNPTNNVLNTKVTSSLPSYMKWLGVTSPVTEDISYDSIGNQIVWNIGTIKSGSGMTLPAREVSFQISLTPSLSQVGSAPDILNQAVISGTDSFTNTDVGETKQVITTEIKTDQNVSSGDGVVAQ